MRTLSRRTFKVAVYAQLTRNADRLDSNHTSYFRTYGMAFSYPSSHPHRMSLSLHALLKIDSSATNPPHPTLLIPRLPLSTMLGAHADSHEPQVISSDGTNHALSSNYLTRLWLVVCFVMMNRRYSGGFIRRGKVR
jgi:hypothetical protein